MLPIPVQEFIENPSDVFIEASNILLHIIENILEKPTDEKLRSLFVGSEEVTKLIPVKGALECLFHVGFEEGDDCFFYPYEKGLEPLQEFGKVLEENKTKCIIDKITSAFTSYSKDHLYSTSPRIPLCIDEKHYPENILELEKSFYSKLISASKKVLYYEDSTIQAKARQCIPLDELKSTSKESFDAFQANQETGSSSLKLDLNDFLLFELVKWFKSDCFTWVDNPNCDYCNGESQKKSTLTPNNEEKLWDVGIVEGYTCKSCSKEIRFPRFNHPSKLLETRKGRCGEWSNCFTLLCRTLGFDVRLVEDFTDHAWTEVYSNSLKRWIHVDPCEAIWDQPLIYEHGWKKKLTYIIAHSHKEIVDVTWRYSSKHQEVLSRRLACREQWLLDILEKINLTKQSLMHPSAKQALLERRIVELTEFLCPRSPSEKDGKGRNSGSLLWRLQRGECLADKEKIKPYVFMLTSEEIKSKLFHVKYSSTEDVYIRNSSISIKGWRTCVYISENIFRKIENDWKVCYLAREEGTDSARIMWKFDFCALEMKVELVKIIYETRVFENGSVVWKLCSDNHCLVLPSGKNEFLSSDLCGSKVLTLEANLSKGKGDCAWQHTQLFRQTLTNHGEYTFDVYITFS